MFSAKQIMKNKSESKNLSLEFIAGLIVGEGCFTQYKQKNGSGRVFVFALKMHWRDEELIKNVRNSLGLYCNIYKYHCKDDRKIAGFHITDKSQLEDIVIPAFDGRLSGYKKIQFDKWKKEFYENKKKSKYRKRIYIKDALQEMNLPFYQE